MARPLRTEFPGAFYHGMNRGNTGMNINWVKKTFLSKESNSKEIPQLKILKPRPTPDDLIQAVFDEFGCGMESILQKGKKSNIARDLAIYLCRELTGETSVSLGRRFDISGAGITARHAGSRKNLRRIASLRGRTIESEGKYFIFEMRARPRL